MDRIGRRQRQCFLFYVTEKIKGCLYLSTFEVQIGVDAEIKQAFKNRLGQVENYNDFIRMEGKGSTFYFTFLLKL